MAFEDWYWCGIFQRNTTGLDVPSTWNGRQTSPYVAVQGGRPDQSGYGIDNNLMYYRYLGE